MVVKFPKWFFVAQIIGELNENDEHEVSYLRKSSKIDGTFIFANVSDIPIVEKNDILFVLKNPKSAITEKQSQIYKFSMTFHGLNMLQSVL